MVIRKPIDVLRFWEQEHGLITNETWRKQFLNHELMNSILEHRSEKIEVAIRRNVKLRGVLEDLYKQDDRLQEFYDKHYPYRNSQPEDAPSKIEQREKDAGRWGRRWI